MSKRVVIIGCGVIGLCCAYYAAKRGHRVTVLHRNSSEYEGCSHGNAGMIVPSHFVPLAAPGMVAMGLRMMWNPESPFYIQPRCDWELAKWAFQFWRAANPYRVRLAEPLLRDLNLASRACYEELDAAWPTGNQAPEVDPKKSEINESLLTSAATGGEAGGFGLVRRGLLMLCKTQHALMEEARYAGRANTLGVPAEVWTPRQVAARDPSVTLDIAGAIYFPKDAHLSPNRFMAALRAECEKLGVEFRWNTEATGARVAGGKLEAVTVAAGAQDSTVRSELSADEFILAAGAWLPEFARSLELRLPMQAGKGYSLTLTRPPQLPTMCHILAEARVAVTPMDGALRFGGTMEIAGLNEDVNSARVWGIVKSALRYYPEFRANDFARIRPWVGLRPCSPDGLPYLGRTRRFRNLTVATGHAMMGLSLGPITGRLVGEILSDEKPSHDLALLAPDRFA